MKDEDPVDLIRQILDVGQEIAKVKPEIAVIITRHKYQDELQADAGTARRSRVQKQNAARKRGRNVTAAAAKLRRKVEEAALVYRKRHAYDRDKRSTRRMASDLATELGASEHTIRGHLRRLGIE